MRHVKRNDNCNNEFKKYQKREENDNVNELQNCEKCSLNFYYFNIILVILMWTNANCWNMSWNNNYFLNDEIIKRFIIWKMWMCI